jgi:deoxyadenosine/deoxycytidine kinase
LEADRNVFAKMLHDDGMIATVNYNVYQRLYMDTSDHYLADGIVFMNTDTAKCHERIQLRKRDGENGISLDYLNKCARYYTEWLAVDDRPILTIDSNPDVDYSDVAGEGASWMNQVREFIQRIQKQR